MEQSNSAERLSFFGRLVIALRLAFNGAFAREVNQALQAHQNQPQALPPERVHASGLFLLSALQREGRLLDFLQQDLAGFSDEEIGAAARFTHTGCRKVVNQYFHFEPAASESEGSSITLPSGFNAQRFRLTGNVAGQPPFRGTLKHHGWVATEVRMPPVSEAIEPRVVAPAEVELP